MARMIRRIRRWLADRWLESASTHELAELLPDVKQRLTDLEAPVREYR